MLPAAKFAVDHVRLNEAVGEGTEPELEPLTSGLRFRLRRNLARSRSVDAVVDQLKKLRRSDSGVFRSPGEAVGANLEPFCR